MKRNKKTTKLLRYLVGFIVAGIGLTYSGIYFSHMPSSGSNEIETLPAKKRTDEKKQIVLVTQKPKDTPSGKFLDLVYTEAFRRLDMEFVYMHLPAKRASLLSDSGEVDGELSRIYSYDEIHPNVIRVEEPHWSSGFLAVGFEPIRLDGWKSLTDTVYRVNYRRGIKGCEINLPKVVRPDNLELVDNIHNGFEKILSKRGDIFIGSEMDIMSVLKSNTYKNSGLKIVGIMERFTGHAFLHKRNSEIVPKLSAVLKKMKDEGLLSRYRESASLKSYIGTPKANKINEN